MKHRNEKKLEQFSFIFSNELTRVFGKRVLGPVIPSIPRIRSFYIRTIMLKVEKEFSDAELKMAVRKVVRGFYDTQEHRSVTIQVDVDPAF